MLGNNGIALKTMHLLVWQMSKILKKKKKVAEIKCVWNIMLS